MISRASFYTIEARTFAKICICMFSRCSLFRLVICNCASKKAIHLKYVLDESPRDTLGNQEGEHVSPRATSMKHCWRKDDKTEVILLRPHHEKAGFFAKGK